MAEKQTMMLLKAGKDFTTKGLKKFLNDTHGGKKTGKEFTIGDIQQYVIKGALPKEYGGHPLEVRENDEIYLKVISVDFDKPEIKS